MDSLWIFLLTSRIRGCRGGSPRRRGVERSGIVSNSRYILLRISPGKSMKLCILYVCTARTKVMCQITLVDFADMNEGYVHWYSI